MEARCSQAPGPRVLPPRRISVTVVDNEGCKVRFYVVCSVEF